MMIRRQFVQSLAVGMCSAAAFPVSSRAEDASGRNGKPSIESVIEEVLENIRRNGFNADPAVNDGFGGLWINWRTGSDPFQTNLSSSGVPSAKSKKDDSIRHDDLTDLRYLHNLWVYRTVYPRGLDVQSEIERYTRIVKHDFANGRNERGWVYDIVIDLHRLSGDAFFEDLARRLSVYYADDLFKPQIGSVCKIKKDRPRGSYRVDHALAVGGALIQAGKRFDEAAWTHKGKQVLDFVYEHAYLPQLHTFPSELDHILDDDGSANPNERFFREGDTEGGSVKPPALGQIALSMLHTHLATGDDVYLQRAIEILTPLTVADNSLGLWDREYGGYFDKAVFSGTHVKEPGTLKPRQGDKEGARQLHVLQAFVVANRLTNGRFQDMQDRLLDITLNKAYYPTGRGFTYLLARDWTLLPLKDGTKRDWVTTEAMGIALEALLSLQRTDTW